MKKWLLVGVFVLVVAVLAIYGLGDRDERFIRKAFAELAAAAEFSEREDMMKGGIRSRIVGGHFVPDVSVDVSGLPMSVSSRADLIALVFHMRTRMDQLTLELRNIEVDVASDRQHAQLIVSARAQVTGMGQQDTQFKDAEFDWTKTDEDGWKISAMRTIEPIERQ